MNEQSDLDLTQAYLSKHLDFVWYKIVSIPYMYLKGVRHGYEEILSETNGMFDNLVVSGNYGYNIDRRWTIIVGNDKIVQLFIEYIDIESDDICRFDHIKVR